MLSSSSLFTCVHSGLALLLRTLLRLAIDLNIRKPHCLHMGLSPSPVSLVAATSIFVALLSISAAFAPDSVNVELIGPNSIYPCLDEYQLLVAKPNLTNAEYIRLIRVYAAREPTRDVRALNYIREYRLPPNNLLNFDCHFFSAAHKFYCFVFVARNTSSGAIAFRSTPLCKPTVLAHDDASGVDADMSNSLGEEDAEIRLDEHLEPAGSSLDLKNKQSTRYGLSKHRASHQSISEDYADQSGELVEITCECHSKHSVITLNQANMSFVRVDMSQCNFEQNLLENDIGLNEASSEQSLRDNPPVNVCVFQLGLDTASRQLASPFIVIDVSSPPSSSVSTSSPLKVRDGPLAVDSLLRMSNGSIAHTLRSKYLRIESSRAITFTLRVRDTSLSPNRLASQQPETEASNWINLWRPVHYSAVGFAVFLSVAFITLSLICLTVRVRARKVQIELESLGEPPTSESNVAQSSLSQFSFADDGDSLEMDYYDYHSNLLPSGRPASSAKSEQ